MSLKEEKEEKQKAKEGKVKEEIKCLICVRAISCDGEKIKGDDGIVYSFTYREIIGLNKKIFGDTVDKFYCVGCLSRNLRFTVKKIRALVDRWTEIGCELFR